MTWLLYLGLGIYACNLAVGVAARFRGTQFGVWHHVLFAIVCASALAATAFAFHPALFVTLAALAAIPFPSARSAWHPMLAVVGFAGYLAAALLPFA
ncbi:MAG: hypothetical protein AAGA54_06640 [Myxococcota bacterium]